LRYKGFKKVVEKTGTHVLCQIHFSESMVPHVIFVPGNYGKYLNVQKLICSQKYESREIKQQIHCHSVLSATLYACFRPLMFTVFIL